MLLLLLYNIIKIQNITKTNKKVKREVIIIVMIIGDPAAGARPDD